MPTDPTDVPSGWRPDHPPERLRPDSEVVWIASVTCGRCGWPNACRVQRGMRALRLVCQWCGQRSTGIVDPSLRRNVIF